MRTTALPGPNDKYNTEHEKKLTKSFFLTGVHNLAGKNVKEAFFFSLFSSDYYDIAFKK